MNKIRYKTQDARRKVQGARYKAQGFFLAACSLPLASAQRGFSLVSAIFLLVLIAALGTFAVTLSTSQQQSAALDVMGARAYQAARAGIEWAAFGVSQTAAGVQWTGCATPPSFGVLGGTLAPFAVTVTCTSASYTEGITPIWIYTVSSMAKTAGNPGDIGYVERVISVKLGK